MNQPLDKAVWSEEWMMKLLGINKKQLGRLRNERGFPAVHLGRTARVYLAGEVLDWLTKRSDYESAGEQ